MEQIILLEYVLNEKIGDGKYKLKIRKSSGGKVDGRKNFVRTSMRQTTLHEFANIDLDKNNLPEHYVEIIYTVHPKCFIKGEIIKLYLDIQNDLDNYIRSLR